MLPEKENKTVMSPTACSSVSTTLDVQIESNRELTNPPPQLFLASSSPRRKMLLEQLGYQFSIVVPDINEDVLDGERPEDYVARLSCQKAQAGYDLVIKVPKNTQESGAQQGNNEQNHVVLGADTIVVIDNSILGKPKDWDDFKKMMQRLSNNQHQVITSISVVSATQVQTKVVTTKVWFKSLTEKEIKEYWQTNEPQDKAGGYGIQGIGGRLVTRMDGNYHAVVGLPLFETDQILAQFYPITD